MIFSSNVLNSCFTIKYNTMKNVFAYLALTLLMATIQLKAQVIEDFTDDNFTNNPIWYGDTLSFEVLQPPVSGDGSINTDANADDHVLRSKQNTGDAAMVTVNNHAYGEWRFAIADGRNWSISSTNDYKIILMSDDSLRSNLYHGSQNFNGYYLRFDGSASDDFVLYKQSGTTSSPLISTAYPEGDDGNTPIGRTVKITRDSSGLWSVFIDEGFEIEPTTQRGISVLDNQHVASSYFGIVTNIGSPSLSRSLYFDNLYIGEPIGDTLPPQINSLHVLNANSLDILFSESIDLSSGQNTNNYFVNNGVGNPLSALRDDDSLNLIHLTFAQGFPLWVTCMIDVSNVADTNGNAMLTQSESFIFTQNTIPSFRDIIVNELFADPTPQVALPEAEFIELYNKSQTPFNLENWQISDGASTAELDFYVIMPDEYVVLCALSDTALFSAFGSTLGVSNFPSLNNSGDFITLFSQDSEVVDSVHYDISWYRDPNKEDGGWSLELINPEANANCPVWQNWIASNDTSGGSPGAINSVYDTTLDVTSPFVHSIVVDDSLHLTVNFSEALFEPSMTLNNNYLINLGIGNPVQVVANEYLNAVELQLSNPIQNNQVYTLRFFNLTDCNGNVLIPDTVQFFISQSDFKSLVINEIFADPTPQVALPEVEYIELFNPSANSFDLLNWVFADSSTFATIPSFVIDSGEYVLLCHQDHVALFPMVQNIVGLSSFPSINNGGEKLMLFNNSGRVIDSVHFSLDWYRDTQKDDGGWSLEMINPYYTGTCPASTNWSASNALEGGTPGVVNSIYSTAMDTTAPQIMGIRIISNRIIELTFNESMDELDINTIANFYIDNNIGNPDSLQSTPENNLLTLYLSDSLVEEINYNLTASDLHDCSGNLLIENSISFVFSIPQYQDIVINEIFADPSPAIGLPDGEFVELYNRSTKTFDLSGWSFSFNTTNKTLGSYLLMPNSYLILCDDEDSAIYSAFGNVLALESFPTLTNSGGTVKLSDLNENIIDSVSYDESFYKDSEKSEGGWTLELINPYIDNGCPVFSNWTASVNPAGGTPAAINSVFSTAPDTVAPFIAFIEVLNELQIKVYFSEAIDAALITNTSNYQIDHSIGMPYEAFDQNNYTAVTLTLNIPLVQKTFYHLQISNMNDCSGNALNTDNNEFVFYLPQIYDVLINEIMADPTPVVQLSEGDYVELYNNTPYPINLKGWIFGYSSYEKIIEENVFIQPFDYLILCDDEYEEAMKIYGSTYSFSSLDLTDAGSTLILRNSGFGLMHFIEYSEEWYENETKKEGGWSLEQIDPNNPCGEERNWTSTKSTNGGTPGIENSVYADNIDDISPEITRIAYLDSVTILAYFNEILDSVQLRELSAFSVDNGIGNPVNVEPIFPDYSSMLLVFVTPFEKDIIYTLTVFDTIRDCVGNRIGTRNTARFAIPDSASYNDIVINEILADPKEDGFDFIEIYNRSEKIIDLSQLQLSSYNSYENKPEDAFRIAPQGWLVFPSEYYVLSESPYSVKKQYYTSNPDAFIQMDELPSFPSDEGSACIIQNDSTLVDRVSYSDDMHFDLLTTTDGVSLERISFDRSSDDPSNWTSASESVGFATPAYLNSQFSQIIDFEADITVTPEIFSPDNDGYHDVLNIGYLFKEAGYSMNIVIYDSKGRKIKTLVQNYYAGTAKGVISWDGIDENGEKASIGIYIIYVEVYNLSGTLKQYKKTAVLASKL